MTTGTTTMWRSRWAAVGAAVAITLGAGGIGLVDAAKGTGERAVYTAIEPCRLLDTRPNKGVGGRTTPLQAAETYQLTAHGDNGLCTGIPADTVALELNVTGLLNTGATHFTIWDGQGALPIASHVNLAAGQAPTPNSVTTELNGANFSIFNNSATAHVIIDIVGVYQDHHHDDQYYPKAQTYTKAEVDAKTWSSTSLTNEAGVATGFRQTSLALSGSPELVAGASMRVPSDGYIQVNVSGIWEEGSAGQDYAICEVQLNGVGAVTTNDGPWLILNDHGVGVSWDSFSLNTTLPIRSADNPLLLFSGQAINLVCDEQVGTVTVDDVQVSAVFVPTSYSPNLIVIPFPDETPGAPSGDEAVMP